MATRKQAAMMQAAQQQAYAEKAMEPAPEPRGTVLHIAHAAVYGEREENYGDKSVNFTNIADLWSIILRDKLGGNFITPQEVAVCMIQVKAARLMNTGFRHHDSIVDIAGYAECLGAINKEEGAINHHPA